MVRILFVLFVTSTLLSSCINQTPPPLTGTGESIKQDTSPTSDVSPMVPEATVTKNIATPTTIEPTAPDSDTPISPTSDVVTPLGAPEKPAKDTPQSE